MKNTEPKAKIDVKLVLHDSDEDRKQLPRITLNVPTEDGTFEKKKINEVSDDIMKLITAEKANEYKVFVSNGMLGRIIERTRMKQIDEDIEIPVTEIIFEEFDKYGMQAFLNRIADFYKKEKKTMKEDDETITYEKWILQDKPPIDISYDILHGQDWNNIPFLNKIINHPILTRKWDFVNERGYDQNSQLYLNENKTVKIQDMTIEEAYDLLADWLDDFPFKDYSDFCNALALLFTIYIRTALPDGQLPPLFIITANSQGAGKSTLAQVLSAIILGEVAGSVQLPNREEEMNKVIGSELILGTEVIVLDNVNENAVNSSDALSSAISEKKIRFRLLGKSKMIEAENSAIYIMTGNNLSASSDLVDRACFIRLDIEKRAAEREFQTETILADTVKKRDILFSAVHTIVNEWIKNGRKKGIAKHRSSIWAKVISGIFDMLDEHIADEKIDKNGNLVRTLKQFLENDIETRLESNPLFSDWCSFRDAVRKKFGEDSWTISDVFEYGSFRDGCDQEDHNFLGSWFSSGEKYHEATRRRGLGIYIRSQVNKVYGHWKLVATGKRNNKNTYAFKNTEENDDEPI